MSGVTCRLGVRTAILGALLSVTVALEHDATACAGPVRCVPPPAERTAPAGRIGFGALGSVGRMLPAQAYAVDGAGRPVTAFAQAADGRLRLVVVRWTTEGAVDSSFGAGDSGIGVAQLFVDVASDAAGTPRIAGTSDGGLHVAVPLRGIAASQRIAVLRLDGSGRLVGGFGAGGVVVLEGMQLAVGPHELADGAIVLGGETVGAGRLVLLGPDGRQAAGFGQGGALPLTDRPTALTPTSDGLVVGLGTRASNVRILRLLRTGRPDERAGPGGLQQATFDGVAATTPETLRAGGDGTVSVVGTAQRSLPGPTSNAGPEPVRFAVRFPATGAGEPAAALPHGASAVDPAGKVLVAAPGGTQIRRYGIDGRLDRTFARSGSAPARLPRSIARSPAALVVLSDGTILAGGPGSWDEAPLATFLRLHADGTRDKRFGPRLLTLRQTSASLRAHDVIALRVHCDDAAQRRCVVRLRAGARTVRAFVAPGGDRRIPVRVGTTAARRIHRRGRAIVRVRFSVIDEAVRVEAIDAPVVVRRP